MNFLFAKSYSLTNLIICGVFLVDYLPSRQLINFLLDLYAVSKSSVYMTLFLSLSLSQFMVDFRWNFANKFIFFICSYDMEATYFDGSVRNAKRQQLEERLLNVSLAFVLSTLVKLP